MFIYDNIDDFGVVYLVIAYKDLICLLETCPKTEEYFALLVMLKSCNMTEEFDELLKNSKTEYDEIDKIEDNLVWSENKSKIMVLDSKRKYAGVQLYISCNFLCDLIESCTNVELKKEMLELVKTVGKSEEFLKTVNSRFGGGEE